MRCDAVRALLLGAEPEILKGLLDGLGEDAPHIEECTVCRGRVQRIIAATNGLNAGIARAGAPMLDVDAILMQAAGASRGRTDTGGPDATDADTGFRRLVPARGRRAVVAVLAAASIATLLLTRAENRPLPGTPLAEIMAPRPGIEIAEGGNLAVLATDNPDITVLWFYE